MSKQVNIEPLCRIDQIRHDVEFLNDFKSKMIYLLGIMEMAYSNPLMTDKESLEYIEEIHEVMKEVFMKGMK